MEDLTKLYCSFCKNKCCLAAPKCESGRAFAEKILAEGNPSARRCTMCEKNCSYDDLGCSTGQMMAKIKGWK